MINNNCNSNTYPYPLTLEEQLISYICRYENDFFFNKPNVVGVGLGYKQINGFLTKTKCIVVFVSKKIPCSLLSNNTLIPKIYKNYFTDVVESGSFELAKSLKDRIRPTVGGCSIGNATSMSTGTLGCLVEDIHGIYILSNNHVIADSNKAPLGSPIIQPGAFDGGKGSQDTIAFLDRFIPLQFFTPTNSLVNEVDCAIAKVTDLSLVSSNIAIINKPPQGVASPKLMLNVKKVGKMTSLTTGTITLINATIKTNTLKYINQIICNVNASKGDSGALLLDDTNKAVGLLNCVSPNYSSGSPIITVLDKLNVLLVTG